MMPLPTRGAHPLPPKRWTPTSPCVNLPQGSMARSRKGQTMQNIHENSGTGRINIGMGERWCSGISGTLLALYGFIRGPRAWFFGFVAGGLIYRALSGFSLVYRALGW